MTNCPMAGRRPSTWSRIAANNGHGSRGAGKVSVQWVYQSEVFFAGIGGLEDFLIYSYPLISKSRPDFRRFLPPSERLPGKYSIPVGMT